MEDLSGYYSLLRDPTRRKIIEILGTQEKIGFKELRKALDVGVGTVYYHLDMLSKFVDQDKQRKYKLNDRGQSLFRILKEGNLPATLEMNENFSHRLAKWLFLSPIFAKTIRPLRIMPFSLAILFIGAFGSAYANLGPALFFYLKYPEHGFAGLVTLYLFNWIGLFLFAEIFGYVLYKRAGNSLQLLSCVCIASFPMASFPYLYLFLSDSVAGFAQIVMQIWSLLLVSAAFCFGKGLRLDKSIVLSLTAIYVNVAVLFMLGRFS